MPRKDVRLVIDQIKKILNFKKGESIQKLKALNLLEASITKGQNAELVCYAERKILNRLLQLARFKKESSDPSRGALLFGKNCN